MPVSKKRKVAEKDKQQKHVNPGNTNAGKILILVLSLSMVVGLLVSAIFLIINYFN